MAEHENSQHKAPPSRRYSPLQLQLQLPQTLTLHAQWTKWKSMKLCGANPKDRLCLVEMQTGYSGKPPLGMRTGFLLRNGMSSRDPLLGAAGDEAPGLHAFNPDGIVFLPSLHADAGSDLDLDSKAGCGRMDTEIMRAEQGMDSDVAFHFSIEVDAEGEQRRREEFAWRRLKGNRDGDGQAEAQGRRKGFKLVRVSSGTGQQASHFQASGRDDESVAFLEWVMAWPKMTHAFTLELADGQSRALGGRWTLMVVVTAIRLYTLYVKGRTNKFAVDIGKRTLGK
ncbi:hypothetical protein BDV10DRAFT_2385 [Aspergillus recurvatus]